MATATRRKKAQAQKAEVEILDELDEELDELSNEVELDEEVEEFEDEDEVDEDEEVEVKTLPPGKSGKEDKEGDKPKAEKKQRNWVVGDLIKEKHGGNALGCYELTKPFKTSPARNGAFQTLQNEGLVGMDLDSWIEATESLFADEGVEGTGSGAVRFILKATRRVMIKKLPDDHYIVVEPLPEGGYVKFRQDGYPVGHPKFKKAAPKPKATRSVKSRSKAGKSGTQSARRSRKPATS